MRVDSAAPMIDYVSSAYVADGQLKLRNKAAFDKAASAFPDGEYIVTIERKVATRSEQQNRYYWGVVLRLVAEHTGYTADELHEYFKKRFNSKRVVFVDTNGEVKEEDAIGQSTVKLSKITFGDYLKEIIAFAEDDLNVSIPPPAEHWQQSEVA
jgi:hypothetical protein